MSLIIKCKPFSKGEDKLQGLRQHDNKSIRCILVSEHQFLSCSNEKHFAPSEGQEGGGT